jgi:hypothetical protein
LNIYYTEFLSLKDDPKLHGYNVPELVKAFIQAVHDEV